MKFFGKRIGRMLSILLLLFTFASTPIFTGCIEGSKTRTVRLQQKKIEQQKRLIGRLMWGSGFVVVLVLVVGNMMGSKTRRDAERWREDEEG